MAANLNLDQTFPVPPAPGDRNKSSLTMDKALGFLKSLKLPLTFTESAAYLSRLSGSLNLLGLYSHLFPAEFAASTTSTDFELERVDARSFKSRARGGIETGGRDEAGVGGGSNTIANTAERNGLDTNGWVLYNFTGLKSFYSPKEEEFLRLVDERLFPFSVDSLTDEEEEREDYIYVYNLGVDWWNEDFAQLHRGWQLLLVLTHCNLQNDFKVEGWFDEQICEILLSQKDGKVIWDMLTTICGTKEKPLCYLTVAIGILEQDTGNIFIDSTDEVPAEPLDWSVEDIEYLTRQYVEARLILEKAEELLEWLANSPANLKEVIDIWNTCQQ